MLRELSVQNLAVIEDAHVLLQPGFCAWTGETGAGKSLLLGALGLILGERGSAHLIRAGAKELNVTGVFELHKPGLKASVETLLDDTLDEPRLVLRRKWSADGTGKAYINDRPAAVATLKALGEILVDIHGQQESLSLLQPAVQLAMLDAYAGLNDTRKTYQKHAGELRKLRNLARELKDNQQLRQRELALLRFEREELESAKLQPHEDIQLHAELSRLSHAQSLRQFVERISEELYDADGSLFERLGRLHKEASHWAGVDTGLRELADRLGSLVPEVRDVADTARDRAETYEADPGRLAEVERRLQSIRKWENKYKKPLAELLLYRDSLAEREASLTGADEQLGKLDAEIDQLWGEVAQAAMKLRKARQKAARDFAREAQKHLKDLGMPQAELEARLTEIIHSKEPTMADLPADGWDHLELILAANPGEPPQPLRKIASGGEMSRTMLALKTVLAGHENAGTLLVFDEIDSNVGGRLGDMLGRKLHTLGRSHQVICVTHLPQVAGYAEHHWTIRKKTTGKKTTSGIRYLETEEDRLDELALMLRGESATETTRQEAQAILQTARKKPAK